MFLTDFKTNLWETPIWGGSFWRVSRFALLSEKMALYLLTRFGILKLWTNILWLTRFDLGYLQTSKQNNSKLQYSKKVFGKFQDLSRFSRKMVLYLSTKFGIIKPWTNILWNWSFDLGFSETSKQVYRKLQYREKVFGSFKICLAFPKKRFCIR